MKELNFETLQRYRLAVQYRVPPGENALRAPLISTAHVDIDVVDVNDCSPKFWPSPMYELFNNFISIYLIRISNAGFVSL